LLSGKASEAVADLQAAARLDPSAAEPWRELSEAYAAQNRRSQAIAALQQAFRRGLETPRAMHVLGRDALRAGRVDEALWLLARAQAGYSEAGDQPVPLVITQADLAEALDRSGWTMASIEMTVSAMQSSALGMTPSPRDRGEMAELLRRRGDLWQRAGDQAMTLELFADASECYARAASEPTLDAGAIAVRRIYALMRQGRPAAGAQALVERIRAAEGFVEARELSLIRYLTGNTRVGGALADELGRVFAEASASASVRSRIARARAAALPEEAARRVLVEHLRTSPGDTDVATDLLSRFGAEELQERDRALVGLVSARIGEADALATALLADGRGVVACAERLSAASDVPSRVLAGYLRAALGCGGGAGRAARDVASLEATAGAARTEVLGAAAELAGFAGDFELAREILGKVTGEDREAAWARVRALVALQRYGEAADLLEKAVVGAGSGGTDRRLAAAGVAIRAGRSELAESLLQPIAEADRFDERPVELLIALYRTEGQEGQSKLTSQIRRLRESVSSARVLRWIGANELAQRGQWREAEMALLSLAEEDPTSPGLLDLLAEAFVRGGGESVERGRRWFAERVERAPESVDAVAALARLEAAGGDAGAAVERLDGVVAKMPATKLLRLREQIVAVELKDEARAKLLVEARVSAFPRVVDDTLSYADLMLATERGDRLESVLREGIPADVPLTPAQSQGLLRVVTQAAQRDAEVVLSGGAAVSPGLLSLAQERGLSLPAGLQEARVVILAFASPGDRAAIERAFAELVAAGAEERAAMVRISRRLIGSPKPLAGLAFAEALLQGAEPVSSDRLRLAHLVLGEVGVVEDLKRLLPELTKGDRGERLLARIVPTDQPTPKPGLREAEVAYYSAVMAAGMDRAEVAESMYRFVLSLDAEHAMAANNLGYALLERGGDRDEAARLIERAYVNAPDNPHVLDSLGWLRYKQGRLTDEDGALGLGAITLIRRAIDSDAGDPSPEVLSHLGDALWRAGRRDEARQAWQSGYETAKLYVEIIDGESMQVSGFERRTLRLLRDELQKRLEDVRGGREPGVARTWADEKKGE
jgi:tetratricopeptide (TPR) repeat protein